MSNVVIRQRILETLQGQVLSTSALARKVGLSRITVSKYLAALRATHIVQSVHVGKSIAWRHAEHKPALALIARPTVARVVRLSLGDTYAYTLATHPAAVRDALVVITDDAQVARACMLPTVLIGAHAPDAWCIPERFDPFMLDVLVRKLVQEQAESFGGGTHIVIEHLNDLEETLGIHKADVLVRLFARVLREHKLRFEHAQHFAFVLAAPLADEILDDLERTFALLLAHIYEREITPGEQLTHNGITHKVPSLTLATHVETLYE